MKESFIKIPISLLGKDIPKTALLLLGILISNSKQKGYAYGNNKYYSELLNVSVRSISAYLEFLSLNGYIRIVNPKSFKRIIYIENIF